MQSSLSCPLPCSLLCCVVLRCGVVCRAYSASTLSTLQALAGEARYRKVLDTLRAGGSGVTWFQHLSSILSGAVWAADAMFRSQQSLLVHCSDGWDRTVLTHSLAFLALAVLCGGQLNSLHLSACVARRLWLWCGVSRN
jgi:hypothetical protein